MSHQHLGGELSQTNAHKHTLNTSILLIIELLAALVSTDVLFYRLCNVLTSINHISFGDVSVAVRGGKCGITFMMIDRPYWHLDYI